MRYSRFAAALGGASLVSCTTGDTFDRQLIETRDAANASVTYYTNRDVGVSARLSGTDSNGVEHTRDLWVFGDSGGWEANGTPFAGSWGFPTNTASLVPPRPSGSNPPLNAMPAAVTRNAQGRPEGFLSFISGGTPGYPACDLSAGEYPAKWPSGLIRLPEADPRYETVLVFYQSWCVDLSPLTYRPFDGGVAVMTWDANAPDARPTATVLNDRLFAPGRFTNQWWPAGLEKGGTYGQAPYFKPGTYELITLQCGNASHCSAAHWTYAGGSVQQNLDSIKVRANWRYRFDTSAKDDLHPFPPLDTNPDDDCTPTPEEACGAYPRAKRVLTASSDPLTQVWGAPSITFSGSSPVIAYMPGPPSGGTFNRDHVAVRMSPAEGIFSAPVRANLPTGQCTEGCYAPMFHPELDHDGWIYFSYFAHDTVMIPSGKISALRVGRSCMNEFNGGSCR